MEEVHILQPVIILLLVGILAALLVRPLKLSPIVRYSFAGILIGPDELSLIQKSHR
jgi:Kef-type K+ transport system membrane component KefB